MSTGAVALGAERVSREFGGVQALKDVSFAVGEAEIVGLIGPNGAGKTTVLNAITGVDTAFSGRITFRGQDVSRVPAPVRARLGMARTFQRASLFPSMSCFENVAVAALAAGLSQTEARRRAEEAVERVGAGAVAQRLAAEVPLGTQRLVEIARAIVRRPTLMVLDEPLSGLEEAEVERVCRVIQELNAAGLAFLWVEHNTRAVLAISHRVIVLDLGRKIFDGGVDQVGEAKEVLDAYLG
ncbi:MAG: ATP-binding cassette domain-containing protein [Firmicutes bacterium]|nr:ATP-binding cassette domain-containing protein [Bacillota bacterium]